MDFRPSDDHEQIRRAVRAVMADFPDDYWMRKDEAHEYPWEFHEAFSAAGFLGTAIPVEYGGSGLGITECAIVLSEVAASGAAMNGASAVHISMFGINPVVVHGSDEMRRRDLPQVASGAMHVCFSVSEPHLGTDITQVRTTAVRDGDGFVINGRKVWMTKAGESQKVLLLTRTTPLEACRKPTDGMTLFFTDIDRTRMEMRPIRKMGRNAVTSWEVFIDDLRVPASDMVGPEGRGFHCLLDGLNPERILAAAGAIGVGRAALRRAVDYARERVVYGRPIGQNQGIQFPLADSLCRLDAAELVTMQAAWLYDNGLPCGPQASMAKYLAGEASFEAADRALQTHGGMGYACEYHVERYFREARLLRVSPIGENMILSYLSEHVLGLPKSY
jgi:acyl-CoA dehydrogenase